MRANLLAAALLIAVPVHAHEDSDPPVKPVTCTDASRACTVAVARTYLEGRLDQRVRKDMRLAPDVHRWENNVLTAATSGDLLDPKPDGPTLGLRSRGFDRVVAEGDNVVFFWTMLASKADATLHLVHRFLVKSGKAECGDALSPCIKEIETVWCLAAIADEPTLPHEKGPRGGFGCRRGGPVQGAAPAGAPAPAPKAP